MRQPVIAGNWKMYKTVSEAVQFALDFKPHVVNSHHCEIVLAPTFTSLKTLNDRLEGSNIKTAGQNVCDRAGEGAFTGEVSAKMLKDVGCSYVIIGHSERRQYFGETDESVNRKIKVSLAAGLTPIVCVGENLAEREAGLMEKTVGSQVKQGFSSLTEDDLLRILIAYEPVWAIGTGRTATPEIAASMHHFIRSSLAEGWGKSVSQKVRILYGGSVKPENIVSLMSEEEIDGALVGGASLEPESFARIVNYNRV
ncbi:MAG: triose-phosphate isomerase [Blastocatellia bacterium]|nr:triose-phosphate isomerase [Blastocatellia bacterium]